MSFVSIETYLEQSLYFYIKQKDLQKKLTAKTNEENEKNGLRKVELLINHLKGKYNIKDEIDSMPIMGILKFNGNKDYSNASLKIMLDYIKNNEIEKVYTKGNYWILFNKNIEKLNINEIIDEKYRAMILENET